MADTQRCNSIIPQKATKLYIQTSYQLVIIRKVFFYPMTVFNIGNSKHHRWVCTPRICYWKNCAEQKKQLVLSSQLCELQKNVSWRSYSLGKRPTFFVVSTTEPMFWFKLFMVIHTNIFFEHKEFANQSCKHKG